MGFLGFLRREKKEEPQSELPPADVSLSGLSAWLEEELSEKASSARKRSGDLQEKIASGFEGVRESAEKLGKAEFERGDKVYAAVNSVKNTFANRVQSLLGKSPSPALSSYSGMIEFLKRSGDLLRELMSISPRQGAIIANYFKREGSAVIGGARNLNNLVEEFQRFLDYEGKSLFILEETGRIAREIGEGLESLRELEMRQSEIRGGIQGLKKELSKREENLHVISKDSRWKNLEKARKEKETLEGRAMDLKFRIGEELSSAKRPLKKYLHLKAGELGREDRDFLERFVKSPLKTIMAGGLEQLKPHLLEIKDMVGKGINLKEKEIQKLYELIKRIEAEEINRLIEEHDGISEEIKEKGEATERDFSGLNEEKNRSEEDVKETGEEIEKLGKELMETEERSKNTRKDAENDKGKLETLIYENVNRRVNIDLQA